MIDRLKTRKEISKTRMVVYWITTVIVALEFGVGGVMDILKLPPFFDIMLHLGYPPYFSYIIGAWKIPGAIAIVVPRFSLVKEWAYAGMFFNMTGAVASQLAVGDNAVGLIAPTVFTALVVASWALRYER